MNELYIKQVNLLLRIIPEINKINELALHGGTAINLFYNEMPRLSVDIDLTYIPFSSRQTDLVKIKALLSQLSIRLKKTIPDISIRIGNPTDDEYKIFCKLQNTEVKVEVNTINRGLMGSSELKSLCKTAQERFNTYCEIETVPFEQLFGGKIVAALDRQHPRDLFDVKKLFDHQEICENIIRGFLFCLFSSKRPLDEILNPKQINVSSLIENSFAGMTSEHFSYETYKNVREKLISTILKSLKNEEKEMIIRFAELKPIWIYDNWSNFPGIAWKMKNLERLKNLHPEKFNIQIKKIIDVMA